MKPISIAGEEHLERFYSFCMELQEPYELGWISTISNGHKHVYIYIYIYIIIFIVIIIFYFVYLYIYNWI